jgi:hypothetical protein
MKLNLAHNSEFGRIFGAKRQKPGFPLQVLGFANANPAGFPLQSLARPGAAQNRFAILSPARTHGRAAKLRTQFCDQPRQVLDFSGFVVKKFCGSSLQG